MPTHYDVLGVPPGATDGQIREAYRELARRHHPDRVAADPRSAASGASMPEINEAYRVLSDPARRSVYDASLRTRSASTSAAASDGRRSSSSARPVSPHPPVHPSHAGPARFPWRGALFVAVLGVIAVVVLAQFVEPGPEAGPDGILRVGDCVTIEPNGDAREVSCTDDPSVDNVVRAFVPFSDTCPAGSAPHRDRQGMGVACVEFPDG